MQIDHLDKQTVDGAQLNLDALYQICPSCFTEAKGEDGLLKHVVNFEKLRALLGDNLEVLKLLLQMEMNAQVRKKRKELGELKEQLKEFGL